MTSSSSKTDIQEKPRTHSTRSSETSEKSRIEHKHERKMQASKSVPVAKTPYTTPRSRQHSSRTTSTVTPPSPSPFKAPITPVGSITPFLPPCRQTTPPPPAQGSTLRENLPKTISPITSAQPSPVTPKEPSISPSIPSPVPIISPPYHFGQWEASYSIPPGAEEPDVNDLSTKFLPPDSQSSSPAVVTEPVKLKPLSLPAAKVDVLVQRSLDDFYNHIVSWNPAWLGERGEEGFV